MDRNAIYCSKPTVDRLIHEVTIEAVGSAEEDDDGFCCFQIRDEKGEKKRLWIRFDKENAGAGWLAVEPWEEEVG